MEQIKLLFAGDYCMRLKGLEQLYDEKIEELARPVRELTKRYDVSVVNVETVFTDELQEIKKSGPNLSSPLKALDLLQTYGFTIGALANNHTSDQGEKLGLRSKEMIEAAGMRTFGYGKCLDDARKSIRLTVKGKQISFLNYAENEFVPATVDSAGLSPMDECACARQVAEEKAISDYVFVYLHAGMEHCPFPRKGLREFSRRMIDSGADGVIISHPHCPQGIEYYAGKPIAYSLGNFFMCKSSSEFSLWNTGYMAEVVIDEEGTVTLTPIPYEFGVECEYFRFLSGERKERFLEYLAQLSGLIVETDEDEYQKLLYAWSLLYQKEAWGWIENFVRDQSPDGEFYMFIRNAFCCESHNEVWSNYFRLLTDGRCECFEEQKETIKKLQVCPITESIF